MNSDTDEGNNAVRQQPSPEPQPSGDVFVIKGMQLTIPPGGLALRFSEEGTIELANLTLHVGLDMCSHWLQIAYDHLQVAESNNRDVQLHLADSDGEQLGIALEKEFSAAMQAITASAIAVDAFYAAVKERIQVPAELSSASKVKGTARYKQISEILRVAFSIGPKSHQQVRATLKEVMRFRDWAVHPPAKIGAPVFHPELNKSTEWRFVAYRFQNAKSAVNVVLSLVAQLVTKPKEKYPRLQQYCDGLRRSMSPLVEKWENRYDMLYVREKRDNSMASAK